MSGTIADRVAEIMLAYGLIGVIALVLGVAVYKLYKRNQELHDTLYENGRESVQAIQAMTAALNRQTDLLLSMRRAPE